ncbi:hypothetical protein EZV62_023522 [Acer yangbiense]|uniref:RanBD1 domain-containing protein n=1 Tax=Acer yangbiense TaxID=1000413 RepID=A0A5C7H1Z2_9ROSI|nr:hypothetical protein EZV62_023522 [Acer yangbiense]
MKGAKRLAVSDSATDTNDSAFRNKRIMAGFRFGDHRAEPSQQRSSVTSTLDMQRAESSRQHVRALNAQFSSWVQTQLKNHPDELWEDGVRDYLAHASDIMYKFPDVVSYSDLVPLQIAEKFSDVVSWLKANAQKGGNLSASESHLAEKKLVHGTKSNEVKLSQEKTFTPAPMTSSFASSWSFTEKKLVPEIRNNEVKLSQEKIFTPTVTSSFATNVTPTTVTSSFATNVTPTTVTTSSFATNVTPTTVTSSFANPWASGVFPSSQPSVFFGNQSSIPTNHNSSNDVNDVARLVYSMCVSFEISKRTVSLMHLKELVLMSCYNESLDAHVHRILILQREKMVALGYITMFTDNLQFCMSNLEPYLCFEGLELGTVTEDESPQPSSPSVKKSEEKGIVVVHEVKCKLYLKSSDPTDKDTWKDKGTGKLSIKCKEGVSKGTKESKPTILVRNDVGKVLLNALLYQGIKTNLQKNSLVAIFHTSADDSGENGSVVARTFLIRTKTEADRDKLATAIQEYAPAS